MSKRFLILITTIFASTSAFGWGELGHKIVGEIASQYLSDKSKKVVSEILGKESLVEASLWADKIKSDPQWKSSTHWHYADQRPGQKYIVSEHGDVIEATQEMIRALSDSSKKSIRYRGEKISRTEALKFLIHFVGDLHQPLHLGNGFDAGGNACTVKWFGKSQHGDQIWNLHAVWDFGLPAVALFTKNLSKAEISEIQKTGVEDWAEESRRLRPSLYPQLKGHSDNEVEQIYCKKYKLFGRRISGDEVKALAKEIERDRDIPNLGKEYQKANLPIVRSQLVKAGIRLAGLLNKIFE